MIEADHILRDSPYVGYAYSYPHKTAYRPLNPPISLADAWAGEPRNALFLYMHVPFCEGRCGYCNLFSVSQPESGLTDAYVEAVRRQAVRVRDSVGALHFARMAIGGGTPTVLRIDQLEVILRVCQDVMGVSPGRAPASVEVSPVTATADKLTLLRQFGVRRISIGVETFNEDEAGLLLRPQTNHSVHEALTAIRHAGFPVLNIDLIYGSPGQTPTAWLESLRQALVYEPEELYLYPLYVRPLTGLGRREGHWEDGRLLAYRIGRQFLLANGYEQLSMRMFRRANAASPSDSDYCCQRDGMIGIGCAARSYTARLHYGWPHATGRSAALAILDGFIRCEPESFGWANHGVWLDDEDRRRRLVLKTLLRCEGLSRIDYVGEFGSDAVADQPELESMIHLGLIEAKADRLVLTELGLDRSDAIGPALYSRRVRKLMDTCQCQ